MLSWFDESGDQHLRPEEESIVAKELAIIEAAARIADEQLAAAESQRVNAAQREVDALRQRLRDLGIDPDSVE